MSELLLLLSSKTVGLFIVIPGQYKTLILDSLGSDEDYQVTSAQLPWSLDPSPSMGCRLPDKYKGQGLSKEAV